MREANLAAAAVKGLEEEAARLREELAALKASSAEDAARLM